MIDLPQEAIEAAARAMYEQRPQASDPVHWETPWHEVPEKWKAGQARAAISVLTAALPAIEAAIRDEIEREALELRPSEPITSLDGLTARDVACLARDGIRTISELTAKTPEYLHSIRNLGKIGANRIETALAARGLSLTGHASLEARLREQIAQEIEVEMRYHDHQQIGFSAIGDAYAHAARIAREGGRK